MFALECRLENSHLFFFVDGKRWLVDTGSPISIGSSEFLEIGGTTLRLAATLHADGDVEDGRAFGHQALLQSAFDEEFSLNARNLSRDIGLEISGLIGMDFLAHRYFLIDPHRGRVEIHDARPECDGHVVALNPVFQFQTVDANLGGHSTKLIFDTGAPLSYWQSDQRKHFPRQRDYPDLHPFLGRFVTDVHRVPTTVGTWSTDIEFGELPGSLGFMIQVCGLSGILGLDVLGESPLGLFVPNRELVIPFS